MNAISDKARTAAMQFEAKKNSLTQVQSGDWKLQFTVSAQDVPAGLLTAAMGTRYVVAIVEVNDQEEPVEQKPASNPHRLSQQAAMLCGEQKFQAYLMSVFRETWEGSTKYDRTDIAADTVRLICGVSSRSEFDRSPRAANEWRDVKASFEMWKLTA